MRTGGVYHIVNTANGKRYVGSAVDFDKRWALHRLSLRKNTHHAKALQRAWNKYGEDRFSFAPLFVCESKDLLFYEQRALDILVPEYNSARVAGSTLGLKHSVEARANMSAGQKGKKFSEEHRAKLSEKLRGRRMSEESKTAMSEKRRGIKQSPENVEKNRKGHIGLRHSEETKAKISAIVRARPPITEETRARIVSAAKSRKAPPSQTAHTRAKRGEAMREYWRKIREGEIERKGSTK